MSYESRAYDDQHGDPVVVLVVKGTHDVSRLVHLMQRVGNVEHVQLGHQILRQVRGHNGGRAALKLLAEHGGPDFTAPPAADDIDDEQVAYWGSLQRQDFISAGPDGKVDLSYDASARRVDPVTARTLADQLLAAADYAERSATAQNARGQEVAG